MDIKTPESPLQVAYDPRRFEMYVTTGGERIYLLDGAQCSPTRPNHLGFLPHCEGAYTTPFSAESEKAFAEAALPLIQQGAYSEQAKSILSGIIA